MALSKKKRIRRLKIIIFSSIAGFFVLSGLIVFNMMGAFKPFFWNIPYLAGFLGPKEYLVVLQNHHEIRPTGGFITAYAHVKFIFGYPQITVNDVYKIPDPNPKIPAEEPFEYFIGQNDQFFGGATFRDANFSPDFLTSSQELIRFYQMAKPDSEIDGVIAVDFHILEKLLELYGPITVEGQEFTNENFFGLIQKISKDVDTHNQKALEDRKNIMGPFGKELISRVISSPMKWPVLSSLMADMGQKKHLQMSFISEALQNKAETQGVSPRLIPVPAEEDYIHLNIANIGGRKADRYVTKSIKYRANFENPDNTFGHITAELEHLGSYNIQSDVYQAYVRAYAPLGSKLIEGSRGVLKSTQQSDEAGFTIFEDYLRLKPGERLTLNYKYRYPETINPQNYHLTVNPQAGHQNTTWQIAVKHMNDTAMRSIRGDGLLEMNVRENLAIWQGDIEQQQKIILSQEADLGGPIVMWQKFENLQRINIRFHELLDPSTAENELNYSLEDSNKIDSNTDSIDIIKAEFDERDVWLTISGATQQFGEFYTLRMRDITDVHGNMINPNPLERTLVQRIESPTINP